MWDGALTTSSFVAASMVKYVYVFPDVKEKKRGPQNDTPSFGASETLLESLTKGNETRWSAEPDVKLIGLIEDGVISTKEDVSQLLIN